MFAFASLVTVSVFYPPTSLNLPTLFGSLIGCVVGSLMPDMDQSSNRLWDLLPGGDYLGKIFRRVFLGHRSLSHSLLGVFLLYLLLSWLLPKLFDPSFIYPTLVLISVMIGTISHLVADSLTEEGVPLFFPLGYKFGFPPITSWRIKTGKWFEEFVIFPGIFVYLFAFIASYQSQLITILKLVTNKSP